MNEALHPALFRIQGSYEAQACNATQLMPDVIPAVEQLAD